MPVLNDPGEAIPVPPGPVHANDTAPVAPPLSVTFVPGHALVGFTVAVTEVGAVATTESAVVVTELVPQELVAVKV